LASIASYIRSKGKRVKIIDAPAEHISVEGFEKYLKDNINNFRAKYVGFTATTMAIKNAYAMAKVIRHVYPEAKIIFGGAHCAALPDEVIAHSEVDIVVCGEGEITTDDILSGKDSPEISGIIYKDNNKVIKNSSRERIKDLDSLPFPAYDLLPMDKYYPAKGSYKRLPAISMLTSRGCPGRCTFCNKTLGTTMVFRSAQSLVEEIKMLVKDYGIKQIMFYDDTFTTHKENVRQFCELLLKDEVDISWCCFSRVDFIDLDLLKLMKETGCHQIMYGIESGNQTVLNSINKNIDLDLVRKIVKLTKQAKIDVRGAFMIGNPIETRSTVLETLDFAIELNPEIAIFNITTPYPGTAMFEEAKQNNMLLTHDWDDYDLSKPVMKLQNMSQQEIADLYHFCYKKYYFRPKYILMRIGRLFTHPEEIKSAFSSLKAVFSFLRN
jgi:radical SAM superfamily enzyme YgiQ (UPF0313 family)